MEAGFPFLAFAKTELFHEFGGGVAEPDGDGFVHGLLGQVLSFKPGVGGGARFFGKTKRDYGMGEDEAGFWHANTFDCLETSGGKA